MAVPKLTGQAGIKAPSKTGLDMPTSVPRRTVLEKLASHGMDTKTASELTERTDPDSLLEMIACLEECKITGNDLCRVIFLFREASPGQFINLVQNLSNLKDMGPIDTSDLLALLENLSMRPPEDLYQLEALSAGYYACAKRHIPHPVRLMNHLLVRPTIGEHPMYKLGGMLSNVLSVDLALSILEEHPSIDPYVITLMQLNEAKDPLGFLDWCKKEKIPDYDLYRLGDIISHLVKKRVGNPHIIAKRLYELHPNDIQETFSALQEIGRFPENENEIVFIVSMARQARAFKRYLNELSQPLKDIRYDICESLIAYTAPQLNENKRYNLCLNLDGRSIAGAAILLPSVISNLGMPVVKEMVGVSYITRSDQAEVIKGLSVLTKIFGPHRISVASPHTATVAALIAARHKGIDAATLSEYLGDNIASNLYLQLTEKDQMDHFHAFHIVEHLRKTLVRGNFIGRKYLSLLDSMVWSGPLYPAWFRNTPSHEFEAKILELNLIPAEIYTFILKSSPEGLPPTLDTFLYRLKYYKEKQNITAFGRWTLRLLRGEPTYRFADTTTKRALCIMSDSDRNGSFYDDARYLEGFLDAGYSMEFFQAASAEQMREKLRSSKQRYDLLIISGHGESSSVQLQQSPEKIFDGDEETLSLIKEKTSPNAKIVLVSCSTAKEVNGTSLAKRMFERTGRSVFASIADIAWRGCKFSEYDGYPSITECSFVTVPERNAQSPVESEEAGTILR